MSRMCSSNFSSYESNSPDFRSRDNQIQDASQDLNALRGENSEIYEENNKLNYDLDALKKHIELLNYLNTQVLII